jgi:hypothetical protein
MKDLRLCGLFENISSLKPALIPDYDDSILDLKVESI